MYFTSEIVFYSGNLSFSREKLVIPVLIEKIQVLAPKTRLSSGKEYFTPAIVFLQWKTSFVLEENLYKSRFFPLEKTVLFRKIQVLTPKTFCSKNISFNTENEVFPWKSVLYI